MNSTGMNSVSVTQGYTQTPTTETTPTNTGRSRSGHDVTEATPVPVLSSPEMHKAATTAPAYKKGATIGQRLACPFATAGNLLVKTAYAVAKGARILACAPGSLAGGIAGLAVGIPVAGVVKLVEMLAGTNTNYGLKVILGGVAVGGIIGSSVTGGAGAFAGALAGVGLGIVSGLIGFGKGVRDAVRGDVHRLEREKLTLKDFFEQIMRDEEDAGKGLAAQVQKLSTSKHDGLLSPAGSPAVPLESPSRVSAGDQNPSDFSTASLDFVQANVTTGSV
ncbi:hypothetical protein [Endozoicomonas euniceicola]|uniref:Uncharacterized protein n=1 Tax=Endozoicomonas euniceicola TaxID=1234143 RepID=A0ABY6GZ09_9GAMM|nr:hypothetical protein [Endozoicomonas euniceicola]UYM18025.1 hypothetical protein NX720_09005 [Endozoicomonas euniceicola]